MEKLRDDLKDEREGKGKFENTHWTIFTTTKQGIRENTRTWFNFFVLDNNNCNIKKSNMQKKKKLLRICGT